MPNTTMYLPTGFYTAALKFSGVYVPTGAAITFQGSNDTDLSAAAIAAAIKTAVWDNVKDHLTDGVRCDSIYVRKGQNVGPGPSTEIAVGTAGAIATPGASPAVSFIVKKVTASGGRRNRGRLFVPGVSEASVDGSGVVLPATLALMQTDWNDALTALATANIDMCIAHRYEAGAPVMLSPEPVTSLVVEGLVATQRRRQRR
jgi:hypothetical protein